MSEIAGKRRLCVRPLDRHAKFCRLIAEINGPCNLSIKFKGNRERTKAMKWSLAVAISALAIAAGSRVASAQMPPQCAAFGQVKEEAEKKALAVRGAIQRKSDRKEICTLVQRFYAAEGKVLTFLEANKTWCNIPDQAISNAKNGHANTLKIQTAACAEGPSGKPPPPSLSDAISTPSVDTAGNTKTGRGTLDSLNGNPLAK
jgi:hypothetical protein